MKSKKNNKDKKSTPLIKLTITKKIVFLYVFLSLLTVLFTSVFSFIFFINDIDKKIKHVDESKNLIKKKIEEKFFKLEEKNEGSNKYEIPNSKEFFEEDYQNSQSPFTPILKDYPDYSFKFENIEGTLEYKEDSKLIYDNLKGRYFVEVTRQINFSENIPFKNLKLSVKYSFYSIILRSLLLASLITLALLIPLILVFSKNIINPIISLTKGAREIAGGNLGIKVKTGLGDELAELGRSFNYMSNELHKIKSIRDDLLAVISHELRSPLGRIKGYTELLNDLKLNRKEKQEYFESILFEIDFLNKMVGEIIEISRLELKKEQLFFELADLSLLISEVQQEISIMKKIASNIEFVFEVKERLFCNVDVEKIKRVFINVIENSIKAQATKIYIYAYSDDNYIKIKIIDNGVGIPEDKLEIVFEKFYRVDKSRDRLTGGFGLGLSICRGIINEHNGNIYFVKRDSGAELNIELSLLKEE